MVSRVACLRIWQVALILCQLIGHRTIEMLDKTTHRNLFRCLLLWHSTIASYSLQMRELRPSKVIFLKVTQPAHYVPYRIFWKEFIRSWINGCSAMVTWFMWLWYIGLIQATYRQAKAELFTCPCICVAAESYVKEDAGWSPTEQLSLCALQQSSPTLSYLKEILLLNINNSCWVDLYYNYLGIINSCYLGSLCSVYTVSFHFPCNKPIMSCYWYNWCLYKFLTDLDKNEIEYHYKNI